jgi:hypothetical protein
MANRWFRRDAFSAAAWAGLFGDVSKNVTGGWFHAANLAMGPRHRLGDDHAAVGA